MKRAVVCVAFFVFFCAEVAAQETPVVEADGGGAIASEDAAVPAAEPAPALDLPEDQSLSASDLAALGLEPEGGGLDTSFHFSGFADFTAYFPIKSDNTSGAGLGIPTRSTFYVGNINLYLSKNLSDNFRTMGEVRFTYLPNGALSAATGSSGFEYLSTDVTDYSDNSRNTRWGGIIMQRLYLEWTLHRLAVLRAGQFLTPYGIWNVDHGSPVYIPVQRPYAINSNYFPERQTGFELLGRWDASNRSTLGYHLTLSNGAGPVSEYRDIDKNKAVGVRAYWEHHGNGFFRLGASGYYGRETNASATVRVTDTSIRVGSKISSQFDALSSAVDVIYKIHGWHFQTEWVGQQRRYTDAGRDAHAEYFAGVPRAFSRNSFSWATYALVAYQLPWYGITPYVLGQRTHEVLLGGIPDYLLRATVAHAGATIHPVDAVTFKLEYLHASFANGGPLFNVALQRLQFQAAWAF